MGDLEVVVGGSKKLYVCNLRCKIPGVPGKMDLNDLWNTLQETLLIDNAKRRAAEAHLLEVCAGTHRVAIFWRLEPYNQPGDRREHFLARAL